MPAPIRSPKSAQPARLAAAALTFIVWALLTASVLWWWLRAGSGAAAPEAPVAGRASADLDSTAVARALGSTGAAAAPQAPEEKKDTAADDARFALRGVLTHGQGGAALIAVGGKVRPVRVGAPVGDDAKGWTLREALPHAAVLAGDGRQLRLDMPGDEERSRIFKEHTGIGYKEYVTGKRIEFSKQLLLNTADSISDIAVKSGFIDSSSFSRMFKNNCGVSPNKFRE